MARDFVAARGLASAIQTSVRATTKLTCSLGVSTSKVVSKIASDRRKPGGITVVPPGTEARFLAPLPIRVLPGVGPRAEERLRGRGIDTIGGLAALSDLELRGVLPGSVGALLRDRAQGIDPRDLDLELEQASVSAEVHVSSDVTDRDLRTRSCDVSAEPVSERLRSSGLSVAPAATAKPAAGLPSAPVRRPLAAATDEAEEITVVACGLIDCGLARQAKARCGSSASASSPARPTASPRSMASVQAEGAAGQVVGPPSPFEISSPRQTATWTPASLHAPALSRGLPSSARRRCHGRRREDARALRPGILRRAPQSATPCLDGFEECSPMRSGGDSCEALADGEMKDMRHDFSAQFSAEVNKRHLWNWVLTNMLSVPASNWELMRLRAPCLSCIKCFLDQCHCLILMTHLAPAD